MASELSKRSRGQSEAVGAQPAISDSRMGQRYYQEGGLSIEEIDAIIGSPVPVIELMKERRENHGKVNRLEGHVPLASHLEVTQHLPSYPEHAVIQQAAPREVAYGGRILDVATTIGAMIGGGGQGVEKHSVMDPTYAPGRVYRDLYVRQKASRGEYTPLAATESVFALFKVDTEHARHPFEGHASIYQDQGDFRLYDVMASSDAAGENSYMHRLRPVWKQSEDDSQPEIADLIEESALLSEVSMEFEAELRTEMSHMPGAYEKIIDGVIIGFGRTFTERGYNMYANRHHKNPLLNRKILDTLKQFEDGVSSPMGWRIPVRAYLEYQAMKAHIDQKGMSSVGIERRRDSIRREVAQGLSMVRETLALQDMAVRIAKSRNQPVANPIRWTIRTVDRFDKQFARGLAGINTEPHARSAKEVARMYKSLGAKATLLMQPTGGNQLIYFGSLKSEQGRPLPAFSYEDGDCIPAMNPRGAFPHLIASSVYDLDEDLQMDGIVGMFDSKGPEIRRSQRFLVVDLLRAPGKLLQQVVEMGYFENGKPGLQIQPTLSEMLLVQPRDPSLVVTRIDPVHGAHVVDTQQGNKTVPLELRNNMAAQFVLTADKKQVRIRVHKVIDAWTAARQIPGNTVSRSDKKYLRGQYGVSHEGERRGEVSLAAVALQNSAPYVWDSGQKALVTTVAMRSELTRF